MTTKLRYLLIYMVCDLLVNMLNLFCLIASPFLPQRLQSREMESPSPSVIQETVGENRGGVVCMGCTHIPGDFISLSAYGSHFPRSAQG